MHSVPRSDSACLQERSRLNSNFQQAAHHSTQALHPSVGLDKLDSVVGAHCHLQLCLGVLEINQGCCGIFVSHPHTDVQHRATLPLPRLLGTRTVFRVVVSCSTVADAVTHEKRKRVPREQLDALIA
jgi:hypothetical protein